MLLQRDVMHDLAHFFGFQADASSVAWLVGATSISSQRIDATVVVNMQLAALQLAALHFHCK